MGQERAHLNAPLVLNVVWSREGARITCGCPSYYVSEALLTSTLDVVMMWPGP